MSECILLLVWTVPKFIILPFNLSCWWAILQASSSPLAPPNAGLTHTDPSIPLTKLRQPGLQILTWKHSCFSHILFLGGVGGSGYKSNVVSKKIGKVHKHKKRRKKISHNLNSIHFKPLINLCTILADFLPMFQFEIPLALTSYTSTHDLYSAQFEKVLWEIIYKPPNSDSWVMKIP